MSPRPNNPHNEYDPYGLYLPSALWEFDAECTYVKRLIITRLIAPAVLPVARSLSGALTAISRNLQSN